MCADEERAHKQRKRREPSLSELLDLPVFRARDARRYFPDCPATAGMVEAAHRGDLERAEKFLRQGGDVNAAGVNANTPLVFVMASSKEGFRWLLENGADPNFIFPSGNSVTVLAADHSDPDYLRLVLAHGGDPNLQKGKPLYMAVTSGNVENVEQLLDAGADLEARPGIGDTAALSAHFSGRSEVLYILLQRGADHTAKARTGQSLVMSLAGTEARLADRVYDVEEAKKWFAKVKKFLIEERGVDWEAERRKFEEWRAS